MTDGRSMAARRFRDLYEEICADLGGLDHLSEGQKQIARRAAMLSSECERMEAQAARGDAGFSIEIYAILCNCLGRMFGHIGLERRAKPVLDLKTYLAEFDRRKAEAGP